MDNVFSDNINKEENDVEEVKKPEVKKVREPPFKGPFNEKLKVLKKMTIRVKDEKGSKLYDLLPGDFVDGNSFAAKKKQILINTRYLENA